MIVVAANNQNFVGVTKGFGHVAAAIKSLLSNGRPCWVRVFQMFRRRSSPGLAHLSTDRIRGVQQQVLFFSSMGLDAFYDRGSIFSLKHILDDGVP